MFQENSGDNTASTQETPAATHSPSTPQPEQTSGTVSQADPVTALQGVDPKTESASQKIASAQAETSESSEQLQSAALSNNDAALSDTNAALSDTNEALRDPIETITETPVDPSFIEEILALLEVGGPVVMILTLMSFIALTIIIVKCIQFYALRLGQVKAVATALQLFRAGQIESALKQLNGCKNPAAIALDKAIRGFQSELEEIQVREEVIRFANDVLFKLRTGFRPLEVIGSIAPLMGLLGTVLGMIKAFQQLEAAGNQVNPAILSGGIWEALLTTAVGLVVAIPAVASLNWLERKVDRFAHMMNDAVTQVFTVELNPQNTAAKPVTLKAASGQ